MAPTTPGADLEPVTPDRATVPVHPRDVALQLLVIKALSQSLAKREKAIRETTPDGVFERGDTLSVRSPSDRKVKLGSVGASDPAMEAKIVNQQAFNEWVLEHHPDDCVDSEVITATDAELLAVLKEHAPHLIRPVQQPAQWVAETVLKLSAAAGEPVNQHGAMGSYAPPAVEVREKKSVLTVRLEDDALDQIAELWHTRQIDPFRQLPSVS